MEKHEKKKTSLWVKLLKALGTVLLVLVLTILIFTCIFAVYVKQDLSQQVDFDVQDFSVNQTSILYVENKQTGEWEVLQKLYAKENRIWASYEELPSDLIFASTAIEDKRFFEHQGVDWLTTGKACIKLFMGTGEAGGSTITQQLIKNLTNEKEITVRRKIVEIFRALQFEKTHTKEEILEWYLNIIYLGEGCSGVRSASQVYFGKDVSELTLAECAALIGITNNPSLYDPYIHPENNRKRQLIILDEMLQQGIIDQNRYDEAVAQELVFRRGDTDQTEDTQYYSYFVDQVIRDVTADLAEQGGFSTAIAEKMLYCGGYHIYCTLDTDVQEQMDAVYENLENVPKTTSSQQLQSAMVIIDNRTGDVVALCGGVGEKTGSLTFSRATMGMRSPGSTIKPISVYCPALDLGKINPGTVMEDQPFTVMDGRPYPKNQSNVYHGPVTVSYAVGQSLNTIPVRIVDALTPEYCYTFAKDNMGLSTLVSDVDIDGKLYTDAALSPMAMGGLTRGVTVRDMTTAYAAIANDGVYRDARTYTKIVGPDGKVILNNEQNSHVAMKQKAAWYMTSMLHEATKSGTSTAARLEKIDVAAKTGTTTTDVDRWFAAYTPYYTGVVWCGFDVPEEVILSGSGTNPALSMWKQVMVPLHEGLEEAHFPVPETVKTFAYCLDSGLLATEVCRKDPRGNRVRSVQLFAEDAPSDWCDAHEMVTVCKESGCVVTEYCAMYPDNECIEVSTVVKRPDDYEVDTQDAEDEGIVDPEILCTLHTQPPLVEEPEETISGDDMETEQSFLPPAETAEQPVQD